MANHCLEELLRDSYLLFIRITAEQHPARDFTRHTLIKPRIYHGREKRQISTTKEKDKEHVPHVTITFDIDDEEYILDLTLNKQLISEGFFHRYQENGIDKVHRPAPEDVELCHYNGKVRGRPESWAALSTCDGLSGVFYDGQEVHYIEKDTKVVDSDLEVPHFLYKHSDIAEHNKTCGYGGDAYDQEHHASKHNRASRYKRSAEDNEIIKGPYNSNRESKYVELVLVIDNREYKELGENIQRVENHCKTIANIINGLYAPLNIFVALVGVVVWTDHDEISFSENGDTTLTNFLHYRREKLIKEHPNDNAQLLTKFNFNNGVVGKALKGPMCTYEYSGGVNTDHSPVIGLVATTVAHEMGHNFGMEHDATDCECPDEKCIMAASSSTVAPVHWSSCSLKYLLVAFTHGMDYCLKNKPKFLFHSPVCGNGFVEPGEECDCGLPENCDNYCCNPNSCKLHSNATCATGACCDLETCEVKTAGTVCRSADYECDLPEYCTGKSEYCPADVFKMDTEPCNVGKAYCYSGFCRTRTDQCKLLWGETGKSSDDQCYKMNVKGTRHGNCGYNKLNQSFTKCDSEDVLCGMLHCKHLNERLEFGMESVAILSHSFINNKGSIIPCRTAIVDLGINQVDPGLSPDGAKCGADKMCVHQQCMSVTKLRTTFKTCPNNCNGNGICNSLGQCHCEVGFAPPFCESAGPGGSHHSGPATDPDAHKVYVNVLFIIFLGVIPFIAILLFLWHYTRRNFEWMKSPPATSKSPTKSRGGSMFPPEPTKRSEDNHSLLQKDSVEALQTEFFGHFKGFSLTPMKKAEPEPVRPAPLPPAVPPSAPPLTPNAASITSPLGITLKTSTLLSSPSKGLIAPAKNPAVTPVKSPIVNRSSTINIKNDATKPLITKASSFKQDRTTIVNTTSAAPALPPPNPGSSARPIISSPVLENSTCTAKELISPLKNAPKVPFRPAPIVPAVENEQKRPLSTPEVSIHHITPFTDDVKKSVNNTINRIASFLKPGDKKQVTSTIGNSSAVKANKTIDKSTLRNMEISSPIPQSEIGIAKKASSSVDSEQSKTVVMRAQSMRGTQVTKRPPIATFGSMRQPNGKRPVSIPTGVRPKSPPPPLPPGAAVDAGSKEKAKFKIPSLPGYQKPQAKPIIIKNDSNNQYDDCLNKTVPLSNLNEETNIYAVIEESPITPKTSPIGEAKIGNTVSDESVGLLGEIVSEIQNRNFESIYSTSTLPRKSKQNENKLEKPLSPDSSDLYENTCSYKSPGSEYSNMSGNMKSSASSTSSGYILPSAINPPVKQTDEPVNKEVKRPNLSTFKSDKPLVSSFSKSEGPTYKTPISTAAKVAPECDNKTINIKNKPSASPTSKTPPAPTSKTPPSPTSKATPKTISRQTTPPNLINRQTTPTNLRTRKSSPTRPAPTAAPKTNNRSITNSPDLVTSCNNTKTSVKPPDVLNGSPSMKKPAVAATKPNINGLPKGPQKVMNGKAANVKQMQDKNTKPGAAVKANKTNSDQAASKNLASGVKAASRQNSNVASLQQKFENKTNSNPNTVKLSLKSKA